MGGGYRFILCHFLIFISFQGTLDDLIGKSLITLLGQINHVSLTRLSKYCRILNLFKIVNTSIFPAGLNFDQTSSDVEEMREQSVSGRMSTSNSVGEL